MYTITTTTKKWETGSGFGYEESESEQCKEWCESFVDWAEIAGLNSMTAEERESWAKAEAEEYPVDYEYTVDVTDEAGKVIYHGKKWRQEIAKEYYGGEQ